MVQQILQDLSACVEKGKVDRQASYPPDMKGQDGAVELTQKALDEGIAANKILLEGLMVGMKRVGDKFGCGEAFIPDLMISAKAMNAATQILKPYFESDHSSQKGTFIIGTVMGDLHDIGKNIVKMIMEGAGWNVIDLGTNVSTEKFVEALQKNPGASLGMSALLTTTMVNMEKTVKIVKEKFDDTLVVIGGAPVTEKFCQKIGADAYFSTPHLLPDYLENHIKKT
ncbi:MAG: cobalamin-binding protein [Calditrichaeota bacterium]|nr:corrinoid protein [Calditrichota bacterium]RQW05769.1 MAG: cobalamin-binding protein [Calditrichota bacterium]